MTYRIPVGISNRHVHLSQEHLDLLFGEGCGLTKIADLNDGEYACEEKVDIAGNRGMIRGLRVVGPTRTYSQVELSLGDFRSVGIEAAVRESGDVTGTAGITLIGPRGEAVLEKGVIAAARHIHINPKIAQEIKLNNGDLVSVKTQGKRSLIFNNVLVKIDESFGCEMHIDIDEANAGALVNGDLVEIVG